MPHIEFEGGEGEISARERHARNPRFLAFFGKKFDKTRFFSVFESVDISLSPPPNSMCGTSLKSQLLARCGGVVIGGSRDFFSLLFFFYVHFGIFFGIFLFVVEGEFFFLSLSHTTASPVENNTT